MFLLLSNDDGYLSPGLRQLATALASEAARLAVIAPDRDCSGASHSLTLKRPLSVTDQGAGVWSVDGTPSDCVHLALTGYLDSLPDMVVSGINHGANMGEDVLYSGTVAAAFEGHNLGLPAIAVSVAAQQPQHLDSAVKSVIDLYRHLAANPLPQNLFLNINIPDLPYKTSKAAAPPASARATRRGHYKKPKTRAAKPSFGLAPLQPARGRRTKRFPRRRKRLHLRYPATI